MKMIGKINMCYSRRYFMTLLGGLCFSSPLLASNKLSSSVHIVDASTISAHERQKHELLMQKAIEQAVKNPKYPFGCVIADFNSGTILSEGVNAGSLNPTFHGEIAAINDYVHKHGNQKWETVTLYTTGEPCPMCMSAIAWARIPRVVWASSIQTIRESGIEQIDISAVEVANRAKEFYHPEVLIQGVLSEQTNSIFHNRLKT